MTFKINRIPLISYLQLTCLLVYFAASGSGTMVSGSGSGGSSGVYTGTGSGQVISRPSSGTWWNIYITCTLQ